ncbi:hypothetical protein, partial [Lacticaseibacillus paracasei]|uniref:hypothetical protein n=1 Tax=Lacticaseibacillus paracasei TaxID=1597 RepID=UPI00195172C8
WDEGRYFEIGLTFLESGDRVFPAAANATTDNSNAAADQSDLSCASDFVMSVERAISRGSAVIKQAVSTVTGWAGRITRLGQDATGLFTMIAALPGNFGRFFPG